MMMAKGSCEVPCLSALMAEPAPRYIIVGAHVVLPNLVYYKENLSQLHDSFLGEPQGIH